MKRMFAWAFVWAVLLASGCGGKTADDTKKGKDVPNTAKVVFSVGIVSVTDAAGSSPAQTDMVLPVGSTVSTGPKSQCNIIIGDSSYVSIKENSKLVLASLVRKNGALEDSTLDLQSGRIVATPKKLLRDEGFSVKTRTAVAAVRGTKFVVTNEPGEDVKVAVIEGKVEMKPRVPSLEAESAAAEPAALADIRKKIDAAAVVVSENQTASINTASAVALDTAVQSAVAEVKKPAVEGVPVPGLSAELVENVVQSVKKIEISTEQNVAPRAAEEVRELDVLIEGDRAKREESVKATGTLTVSSPVKNAVIRVDDRVIGYGAATVRVDADRTVKIDVKAKDFQNYHAELSVAAGEAKIHDVALVRTKLMDRVAWTSQLGSGIRGDLLFYNGMIIASSSNGSIVCMDRAGTAIWRTSLEGGLDSTPAVSNGKLFAVTKKEKLFAIDAASGKQLWKADLEGSLVFGSAPLVADDSVIVASSSGKVYSFSAAGKQNWMTDLQAGIYATPSRNGGIIYIGADDHKLYALRLKKGGVEWKAKLDSRVVSSAPAVYEGKLYLGTFNGTLYCLKESKGSVEWSMKTGGPILASPVCFKERIYVGSKDAKLYAVNASSGAVVWSLPTGQPVSAEVAILGNELFAAAGRTVSSIDIESGRVNWSYELDGTASSVIADGSGVFVGVGGRLVSLRLELKDIVK